ncbi:hypothetical protein K3169_14400 [Pseudomonas phytophila]|uniref:Uncharacterized protein n=1 Tax=Pseudomonas phytophila TaxID=2867264 RepID=A0ABY6FM08_9PSED|nr:hypothetical protein [Pseudomonas phytophila]UXZ98972.1 hypothetical protein K3169_14400 [Pseudomonas phytophila]
MKKYLYGKERFLKGLIEGKKGIRLSDIAYYSIMENENMRDDELAKEFYYDKNQIQLTIAGRTLNPLEMSANPSFVVSPYRCFCVCLSGKNNDPELFDRFKADVCIEIDVKKLVSFLTVAASNFEGMTVVHNPVDYYPAIMVGPLPDFNAAVFYKRDIYKVEDEYRIALTVPMHREYFKSQDGELVRIFSDDSEDLRHMSVDGNEEWINRSYVTAVTYRNHSSESGSASPASLS